MKHSIRTRCMIFAAAALMVFPGTTVFAKGRGAQRNDRPRQNVCTFVDADKDGICDNRSQTKECRFTDENKDGICDNCNQKDCQNRQELQQDASGQTSSGQASSGQVSSGQASSQSRPLSGCQGQRQGRGQGRGRR